MAIDKTIYSFKTRERTYKFGNNRLQVDKNSYLHKDLVAFTIPIKDFVYHFVVYKKNLVAVMPENSEVSKKLMPHIPQEVVLVPKAKEFNENSFEVLSDHEDIYHYEEGYRLDVEPSQNRFWNFELKRENNKIFSGDADSGFIYKGDNQYYMIPEDQEFPKLKEEKFSLWGCLLYVIIGLLAFYFFYNFME